jgi:hypothetical protein
VYQMPFVAARANPPCIWGSMAVRLIGHVRTQIGRPRDHRAFEQKVQAIMAALSCSQQPILTTQQVNL